MGGVGAHVILTLVPGDARVKRECSGSVLGPNAAAPATVTGEGAQSHWFSQTGKAGPPTGQPEIRKPGDLPAHET